MAGANSKRIFHDQPHSGPTPNQRHGIHGVMRTHGPHRGVDYSASSVTVQYSPFDGGIVRWTGTKGARGKLAQIYYPAIERGLILQHASEIKVDVGQTVDKNTPIVRTGNTGVGTGVHAHVEFFKWDGVRTIDQKDTNYNDTYDWEGIDLTQYDIGLTEEEAKNIIRDLLDDAEDETTGSAWAAKMWEEAKKIKIRYDDRPQAIPTREQVASMMMRAFAPSCLNAVDDETEV